MPPDFLGKLKRLKDGDLAHHFIEQNCRLFAALLAATEDGNFREGSPAERERMLRVLAYVRKDDDAIADYRPEGFADDQREMRAATVELAGLIHAVDAVRQHPVERNALPSKDDAAVADGGVHVVDGKQRHAIGIGRWVLGKRVALGSSSTSPRARKRSCARRRNITKEHEDARRPAPRAGSLRADRGDARPEVRRDH